MKYSFVIPCYKSVLTIGAVVEEIIKKMDSMKESSFEIILVNDFSPDNTKDIIFSIAEKHSNVIAIHLSKNFGQHSALLAGYSNAKGDYIISLDDDGQTPANQVDRLINKLEEGYDIVFARYKHKKHSFFRNLGSIINDFMAVKLIDKPKHLFLSSYFIARNFVIKEIIQYPNPFPYISGLLLRTSGSITNVDVDHRDRNVGQSGYTISSLFKLWLNGFTAFSIKPLRISIYLGMFVAFVGILFAIDAIIKKITNPVTPIGWTSVIAILSFIGGTVLVILGMIGEYVGRIYISINKSPQYIIKEKSNKNN